MTVQSRLRRTLAAGLLAGTAALFSAAAADAQSLTGRWVLAPERSSFVEAVTGPAPQGGEWIVSRDDGDRLAYTLVETRDGDEVARATYDVSLHGGPSQSHVDGDVRNVVAMRANDGSTIIKAPAVAAWRASIRIREVSPSEAVIEHVVSGPIGDLVVERLVMERSSPKLAAPKLATAGVQSAPLQ
jgi:hypothetical protein